MDEGLRLIIALAKDKIGPNRGYTNLCIYQSWTSTDPTNCKSNVHGIEVNLDSYSHCHWLSSLMELHEDEYEKFAKAGVYNKYARFLVLKGHIEKLRMLYINHFSIFDNLGASNEDNITLLEVHQSLKDAKNLSEMRQLQDQMLAEKNTTAQKC
ncbi:unnamed protein product [Meloidogyne enterolobii]|uniref:Uncharacterized protein n=1 Tax=Meloidogyne enterolobii TaxID=390850 RepID=A0ACB0YGN5_MELEN